MAVRRPGIIAEPAKASDALAKFFRDGRREPGVNVFEAAPPGVALGGCVQRQEPLPALARRAGLWIEQQIGFGSQPEKGGAENRAVPFRLIAPSPVSANF